MIKTACILLALGASAGAADFTEVLVDDDGCPLKNEFTTMRTSATIAPEHCRKDDRPDLSLGDLCYYSLKVTIPAEQPQPTGDEKFARSELADRLRRARDLVLNPDEIKMTKKVVGLIWPPSTVGIVYPRIDPSLAKR